MPIFKIASVTAASLFIAAAPIAIPAFSAEAVAAEVEMLADTETAAIKDMFEVSTRALLDGDLDKWKSYWAEGAVLMPPGHASVKGRAALVGLCQQKFRPSGYL